MFKEGTEKKLKMIGFQYETKLQEESDALYSRMNEKIKNQENCYKEVCIQVSSINVVSSAMIITTALNLTSIWCLVYFKKLSVLRRSYQQQLSDAMQVIKASYKVSF